MQPGNGTQISEFILLGFSEDPLLQPLILGLFLSMYLITVVGNFLIILAVSSDSHLHTPMYFFLSNLSLVDICFTSTTVPKMLMNIQTQSKAITYAGCITQIYFLILFSVLDISLLTAMAYDRAAASATDHAILKGRAAVMGSLALPSTRETSDMSQDPTSTTPRDLLTQL
ncbi:Olfactory receptor 7A5 [Myotis davidii]|uniref:Olfactory receptor 7A5 n=1 Tax=Myotis davidii TaxID=225400 RepID=L5LHK9_MYODS|nr:Olfactory receptor 7A5 [Myotis davidii]